MGTNPAMSLRGGGAMRFNLVIRRQWGTGWQRKVLKAQHFEKLKLPDLCSLAPQLVGKEIKHRTDNQGTERIMSVGSKIW